MKKKRVGMKAEIRKKAPHFLCLETFLQVIAVAETSRISKYVIKFMVSLTQ